MHLTSIGKSALSVPFVYNSVIKMTLLKGPDALAARRAVASKLDHSAMKALRRPMHVDKPDWSLMQQLRPRRVIAESDDEPRAQAHAARRGLRRRRRRIRTGAGSAVARIECARERARARARARA